MSPINESVRVIRATLDELRIYEISEAELEAIERGGPESIYLNFALSLGSTAGSFAFSLLTTKIESARWFDFFVIVTLVCGLAALVLGALWRKERKSKKELLDRIRKRMPPPGEPIQSEAQGN